MSSVRPCDIPETAFLCRYRQGDAYADCYMTEVAGTISQRTFVEAFYTTALFKVERVILRLVARPSTDLDARKLAEGGSASFAAWRVEDRSADQLLLGDFTGRTKSWLMAAPVADTGGGARTRLYFGSAVLPRIDARTGARTLGFAFRALLGFHRLYSRLLLGAARSRILSA